MTGIAATRAAWAAMLVAGLCLPGGGGGAQTSGRGNDSIAVRAMPRDSALERLTREVSAQLRCPVCQGLALADSPSELALEMKDVVRTQLAAGRTPDEVKAYFVAKYGEWILLEPPARGINLLAYLLPAGAIVGGLGVVWLMLGRWTGAASGGEETDAAAPLD